MARSSVFVGPGGYRGIKGLDALQQMLAKIPGAVVDQLQPELEASADIMVDLVKSIAPVSDLSPDPGSLRDSVRREPGSHDLADVVVEDGADAEGKPIAAHVEQGHKAKNGTQVPAVPHFWPAYRVTKKRMRSRASRALTKAVKSVKTPTVTT
jgi:hypothetical protein